jgi:hypothetical protein
MVSVPAKKKRFGKSFYFKTGFNVTHVTNREKIFALRRKISFIFRSAKIIFLRPRKKN